jgi:hypothetical protein
MSETANTTRNRRASFRRSPKGGTKVACYKGPLGLGENLALSLLDISEAGACLVLKSEFQAGQAVEVHIEGPSQRRPVKVRAEVIWAVAAADRGWCVGLRFERRLPYADLFPVARI